MFYSDYKGDGIKDKLNLTLHFKFPKKNFKIVCKRLLISMQNAGHLPDKRH